MSNSLTLLFIRHAAHDLLGKSIAGRTSGVGLNKNGLHQAAALGERLSHFPIDGVFSSPLQRAVETAEPICRRLGLAMQIADELNEVVFGGWTGRSFDDLRDDPLWKQFNSFRGATAAPGGELMLEVQARVVRWIATIRHRRCLAIVTHGDVIRATLAHFLGTPLDLFLRIEIDPASVSIVELGGDWVKVRAVNSTSDGSLLPATGASAL